MLSIVILAVGLVSLEPQGQATPERQATVARIGATVMPFDLERTTHAFAPTDTGGVQRVISKDGDATQITLIRDHMRAEADRFAEGDFGSPTSIHGQDMPGLKTLNAHAADIEIGYVDLPQGGEIRYRTDDAALVEAIHAWFSAQVSDHGAHATGAAHAHN